MIKKRILFIGANIITYDVLSYLFNHSLINDEHIYIYDDTYMYKRDYYRLSWWSKSINDKDIASKVCINLFNKCIYVSKDDLIKFGSNIEYPDIVIFTSSHVMKQTSFKRIIDKFIDAKIDIIMAMNHNLYGYYNNNVCKNIDDIKCNTYNLNEYVRINDRVNNDEIMREYINYIYSCSNSVEPDDMSDSFKLVNMNSIYYPLCNMLAMYIIRDITEHYIDTSLFIDWSLLRNNNVHLKRNEEDDYKYIEYSNWVTNMRQMNIIIDIGNNIDSYDIIIKQLYNCGYFRIKKGKLYIVSEKVNELQEIKTNMYDKIIYINSITNNIIHDIDLMICLNNRCDKKVELDDLCIRYQKPCIYLHNYSNIPFIEVVNSIPNMTPTYKETNYIILDKAIIDNKNNKIDWRMEMATSMCIVQWMIHMKIVDKDNIRFKKYMISRIDNKCIANIEKKCKNYYNNTYDNEYNRIIYTIPDNFNNWSRINVYENNDVASKLSELLVHLQDEYGLVPYKIVYGDDILYDKDKYMDNKKIINKLLKPWIYKRTGERYKVIAIFKLYCKDSNGDDLICPPIYYHCGK
jgi:hypothetical protein